MISNYFKLALRVLGRKKFFTAISLFGISFTLAILMVLVSIMETEVGNTKPLTNKSQMVILTNMNLVKQFYDTIYTMDTLYTDGVMQIDSTFKVEKGGQNNSNNSFSYEYLERNLSEMPSIKNRTFMNPTASFNAYVNGSKVELQVAYTDHNFWEVIDAEFIEGFGYAESIVAQEEPVAVITTALSDQYFGKESGVIGEYLEMDGNNLKIIGVIEPPGVSLLTANIFVPYTMNQTVGRGAEIGFGGYMAIYEAHDPSGVQRVKDDIKFINQSLEVHPSVQDDYNEVILRPYSYYELYANQLLDLDEDDSTGKSLGVLKWIMLALVLLFILLPTLNLINLNVSRILERSSEIGVRKAFGASQSTILGQFVIENIVQTFLGGLIGMGLAFLFIYIINDAKLLGDIILKINLRFFLISFFVILLFGILSGLLPAWRMSKLQIVNALKQTKI